ncbi:MAG: hypothetical protein ACK5CL_01665, partial [Sphingomonadales bacterium]
MRLFDAHYHIDRGAEGYNLQSVGRNWIFNRIDQYKEWTDKVPAGDTQTLIFDFQKQQDWVVAESASGRIQGLKIHSRLLGIREHNYPDLF